MLDHNMNNVPPPRPPSDKEHTHHPSLTAGRWWKLAVFSLISV